MATQRGWGWGSSCSDDVAAAGTAPAGAATGTILDEILARTRAELQETKRRVPEQRLRQAAASRAPARDFAAALRGVPGAPPRVIAELKRASPSRGLIRPDFGVMSLTRELVGAGAAALSVLTEVHYFRGSPRYLQAVAGAVEIPVLRKDFIVDPYQLFEARAWGADAALLIAAALEPEQFAELHRLARALGLAVLAEVHNAEELDMVLRVGAQVVGINSRDLRTFRTDLNATEALLEQLPTNVVAVAESGVHDAADIRRLAAAGAHAFLVGEALMRAESPGRMLRALIAADSAP